MNNINKSTNDMWTTNPELAKLLANPEDGYKYKSQSNQKVDWQCPNCGEIIKNKNISKIYLRGLSCPKCGDGISYPEKFMYNLLQQLKIGFKYQYTPNWIKPYRYDFYFVLNNKKYIIEMNGGLGHGKIDTLSNKTIEESKNVDLYKDRLAKEHNIEVIRIDCDYQNANKFNYIKNHIIKSKLTKIINCNYIDWQDININCQKSIIYEVCKYRDKNKNMSTVKISEIFNLSSVTISSYLKIGHKFGWCHYIAEEERANSSYCDKSGFSQQVICVNTNTIYNSIIEASKDVNISSLSISLSCKYKNKTAGYDNNGIPLKWNYYGDILSNNKKKSRQVICLNTNKIFDSAVEASIYYNMKWHIHINSCCNGTRKSAGKLQDGTPLKWMYYDDYNKLI